MRLQCDIVIGVAIATKKLVSLCQRLSREIDCVARGCVSVLPEPANTGNIRDNMDRRRSVQSHTVSTLARQSVHRCSKERTAVQSMACITQDIADNALRAARIAEHSGAENG